MQEFLIGLSTNHAIWIYIFIVVFSFIEGPVLAMVFGVIIKLGYFDFPTVYLALMTGDLLGDIFWYYIGLYYGQRFINKFGKYFRITEEGVEKAKEVFHKNKHKILFISKITNGFGLGLAILLAAGMTKLPFKKYLAVNAMGQIIWTGLLISIGYFFGNLYIKINDIAGRFFITLVLVIIVIAFYRYVKYLQIKAQSLL